MEYLIGHVPLLQRFFRNRGWYRWMPYRFFSEKDEPWGPYPTFEEARILVGDPLPPYEISYHLRMPVGCHDIREKRNNPSWGES